MRSLVSVHAHGLLGQFDHRIHFPANSSFVVLHGPNGVGKTKLLELINGTFSLDLGLIDDLPFESVDFEFDDESFLSVIKTSDQEPNFPIGQPDLKNLAADFSFYFKLTFGREKPRTWTPELSGQDSPIEMFRRLPREFRLRTGVASSKISWRELQRVWARHTSSAGEGSNLALEIAPSWLSEYLAETPVHLIETQRLYVFGDDGTPATVGREAERRNRKSTVTEYAQDLSRQISVALARNSRTSQQLDGSFPRRVLNEPPPGQDVTDDFIRKRYAEQNELREALNEIAVLDDQDDLPLPGEKLETWQRRVLWIYLGDTDAKLATFKHLLDRITLMKDIVNSRFLNKELVIDRDRGFRFQNRLVQDIDPVQLSSGEQHELVLMYDLLFNVREHSVVLIDEPEISLHIVWQQKFLEDIERIAAISNLRFIVATHSPQIVHKWWSRTIALGADVDEEFLRP